MSTECFFCGTEYSDEEQLYCGCCTAERSLSDACREDPYGELYVGLLARHDVDGAQDLPGWIEDPEGMTLADIDAIQKGGCESGAYMPAVTYASARETVDAHGDEILAFLDECGVGADSLPRLNLNETYDQFCVALVSLAVEVWAGWFDVEELATGGFR